MIPGMGTTTQRVADAAKSGPEGEAAEPQPDAQAVSAATTSAPTSALTPDSGPGVAYGNAFVATLRAQGLSGADILRPLIDELNAQTAMPPADKATAARVACNAQGTPGWGAGPVVAMPNGDLIVTSRLCGPEAPVLVVKPDGAVLRGTACLDMFDATTYRVSNVTEGAWPSKPIWIGPSGSLP
jgi:hypothetical protein